MTTRIWHGKTNEKDADAYLAYIRETGLQDYSKTPGDISTKILGSVQDDYWKFLIITKWKDCTPNKRHFARYAMMYRSFCRMKK